jgi:hypothetical protein
LNEGRRKKEEGRGLKDMDSDKARLKRKLPPHKAKQSACDKYNYILFSAEY